MAVVSNNCVVTARAPNEVWHIDLTAVPVTSGFWASWSPFALPQSWPYCWWVIVAVDHFSRRLMMLQVFATKPTSETVCTVLTTIFRGTRCQPKYVICDQDPLFKGKSFKSWSERFAIAIRYGAIGKHGSIAVVERAIRTIKNECTRRILVSLRRTCFLRELMLFQDWYNEHRPHMALAGRTPNEVFFGRHAAIKRPWLEPRRHCHVKSRCTGRQTPVRGQPGDRFRLEVDYHEGRPYLPVVSLRRVA